PSPILGEGGPRKWWVRVCFELKKREIFEFGVAPHPAYSATFSLMEKAKIFGTTINSIDKFSSIESIY
ncbi:MAG: hypothetical protein VW492_11870, partial [Deltaproteobacteria bacterium]